MIWRCMAVATGLAALAFSPPAMAQDAPVAKRSRRACRSFGAGAHPWHGAPRDRPCRSHRAEPACAVPRWVTRGLAGLLRPARTDTPDGTYKAQWVDPDHQSKQYQDAPMPYAVFFDLKGHAFHGSYQKKFGMAVSHGCVRLPVADAKKLYDAVKVAGADVEIIGRARQRLGGPPGRPARTRRAGGQPE